MHRASAAVRAIVSVACMKYSVQKPLAMKGTLTAMVVGPSSCCLAHVVMCDHERRFDELSRV